MKKVDTSHMSGQELYEYYAYVQPDREYRNTVSMAYMDLAEELYPLLERCEREGKRLSIQYDEGLLAAGACDGPYEIVLI